MPEITTAGLATAQNVVTSSGARRAPDPTQQVEEEERSAKEQTLKLEEVQCRLELLRSSVQLATLRAASRIVAHMIFVAATTAVVCNPTPCIRNCFLINRIRSCLLVTFDPFHPRVLIIFRIAKTGPARLL